MKNFHAFETFLNSTLTAHRAIMVSAQTRPEEAILSNDEMSLLLKHNVRAEQAKQLKQLLSDPEITTTEQLVKAVRAARESVLLRKSFAGEGLAKEAEEVKLHFMNMAVYYSQKTEPGEEYLPKDAFLADGTLAPAETSAE